MAAPAYLHYATLAGVLKDLVRDGQFTIAVLTDGNGLPIASSDGDQESSETQSAVVAQVQTVVLHALGHLSMSVLEEISLNDVDGRQLVCRQFALGDSVVYLAILIPNRLKSHRKLMNSAIRMIQKIWNI